MVSSICLELHIVHKRGVSEETLLGVDKKKKKEIRVMTQELVNPKRPNEYTVSLKAYTRTSKHPCQG